MKNYDRKWKSMDMYNRDLKENFLSNYDGETRQTYSYVFIQSYRLEFQYEKDLKDFEKDELKELLKRAKKSTVRSVRSFASMIKKYIQWAIENGYKDSNLNPMSTFTRKDYEECVDKNKMFISEQELIEIEEMLDNYQDKLIVRLPFEGIYGEEASEMLNLTVNDIDFKNRQIKVKNKKGQERVLKLQDRDRLFRILEEAINEKVYYAKSGYKEDGRGTNKYKLVDTEYVIKNTVAPRTTQPNSILTIRKRLGIIKDITGMKYLTLTNINRSGMIRMAYDLWKKRGGELINEQLAEVAEHFGINTVVNNGYEGYNYYELREFINSENIYDLYGIHVEVLKHSKGKKVVKLDQKKIEFIKEIPIDVRAKVIYEFLRNGTIDALLEDEKAWSVIHFYGFNSNNKAQYPDLTLEEVKEGLQKFNESELEEFYLANEEQIEKIYSNIIMTENDGKDVFRTIKTRQGQYKLRKILLRNYQSKCAVCEISHPKLLVTSHIKPWANSSPEERIDPRNAILLCKLHDALFENGFISLSDEYEILFSGNFDFEKQGIQTHIRFKKPLHDAPLPVFLKEHRQKHGYEKVIQ